VIAEKSPVSPREGSSLAKERDHNTFMRNEMKKVQEMMDPIDDDEYEVYMAAENKKVLNRLAPDGSHPKYNKAAPVDASEPEPEPAPVNTQAEQQEREDTYRKELEAKRASRRPPPPAVPKLDIAKQQRQAEAEQYEEEMAQKAAASRAARREAEAASARQAQKEAEAKAANEAEWRAADAELARTKAAEAAAAQEAARARREEREKTGEDKEASAADLYKSYARDVKDGGRAVHTKRSTSASRRGRGDGASDAEKARRREEQNRELEAEKRKKAERPSQYAVKPDVPAPPAAVPRARDAETAAFVQQQEKRMAAMTADLEGEDEDDFAEMMAAESAKFGR